MARLFSRKTARNESAAHSVSATPILDLLEPLPPLADRVVTGKFAVPFLGFVTFVIIVAKNLPFLVVPFGFLTLSAIVVLLHEFGHLLAGWAVGLRFRSIEFGPICIHRIRNNWSFRIRPRFGAGQVSMYWNKPSRIRRRLMIVILGGPLMSYAVAIAAFVIGEFYRMTDSIGWTTFLEFLGIFSFLTAVASTIPYRILYAGNDAFLFKTLLRSKQGAIQMVAGFALNSAMETAEIPPEFHERWARLASSESGTLLSSYYGDFNLYKSAGDATEGAVCLERLLCQYASFSLELRNSFIAEAAYFTGWSRSNLVQAEVWLSRIPNPGWLSRVSMDRVMIAVLVAQERHNEALARCQSTIAFIETQVKGPVSKKIHAEWIAWAEKIEKQKLGDLIPVVESTKSVIT
jgi:hypothetical protein